jgi:hypothetical protein
MSLPSHVGDEVAELAGDGAAGVTLPGHDVDAESCWRWCCWVILVMVLPNDAGDGMWRDVDAKSH